MYIRWIYMVIAIAAALLSFTRPVFNFQEDKGIIYVRSFEMTQTEFIVKQTELDTGIVHVTAVMSLKWLYYCQKAILWGSILCLLCFFSKLWRIWICNLTILACAAYYIVLIYYAVQIADEHFATLYPNLMVIVPAVVLEMMVLTRHNVIIAVQDEADADA